MGIGGSEPIDSYLISTIPNIYVIDTWNVDTYYVKTDNTANCYMRAPGNNVFNI